MDASTEDELRIVLHAPTAAALARARSNAANLARAAQPMSVRIVVNADAVAAALDVPDPTSDPLTLVCPNTLARLERTSREPLTVLHEGAIAAIARMQRDGWCYVRA